MDFAVALIGGGELPIEVEEGRALYVLGPNGTGKSSLLFKLAHDLGETTLIAGNRDIVFDQPGVSITAMDAVRVGKQRRSHSRVPDHRFSRSSLNNRDGLQQIMFSLKSREEFLNEQYLIADQAGDEEKKKEILANKPLKLVNEAFYSASILIKMTWNKDSVLKVEKDGVEEVFDFNRTSDGERAAFVLAATTILADEGATILVDEPERHLHRSISAPLISHLREVRSDLKWIISTHDLTLPRNDPTAQFLVLYSHDGDRWRAESVTDVWKLDPTVTEAICGARDKVLFVEGEIGSLDLPLFNALYRGMTIIPAGACADVLNATLGLRHVPEIHTMEPKGIVDRDNIPNADSLKEKGVFPLEFYAIESVYYHPSVVEAMLAVSGSKSKFPDIISEACSCIPEALIEKLAKDAAYKAFVVRFGMCIPTFDDFTSVEGEMGVNLNPSEIITEKFGQFKTAVDEDDWEAIVTFFKVKSLPSTNRIAQALGFKNSGAYELALRKRLVQDLEFCTEVGKLVPDPFEG
ncbi:AAA family ATPase [Roseovarius sp. C7]|uniref:AAA family ATPase n=1 Tax=Roseovarius sp. C7 TaxID=3398643 RepID=UPI0039F6A162